jgi:predicted type IV restriction endonuclease
MTIDKSKAEFEKFKVEYAKYSNDDISESDTRSKLLDIVLKNVLGWNEENIERERYVKVGYYDYLMKLPSFQFVIEAKKNLKQLNFPVSHKSTSLNSIYVANKEVIDQIRNYLIEVGLQSGVISNGTQYIIGKFVNID